METSNFLNSNQKEIVKEVFVSNSENPRPSKRLKVELMNQVENFMAICKQNLHEEPENAIFGEDAKIYSSKLPNELWMKILTYLTTHDIFANFSLVNNHFHGLTLNPSAIKYIQIKDVAYLQVDKMKKVLKRCKNLKELSITKDAVGNDDAFLVEAMKICKNLKSVKISADTHIRSIARYRRAINTFIENNHSTLKKIDLKISPERSSEGGNVALKSLSLCQNLKELSGTFHQYDMKWISQCRSLIKLQLINMYGYELDQIFDEKMDIPYLKCLSIDGLYFDDDDDYDKLSQQNLPALEKLYLTSDSWFFYDSRATLDLEEILNLVENFPKLNTLHIDDEKLPEANVSNEELCEIFKDYGILVIFGSIYYVSNIQKNFEDFLEHDPLTLEKYKQAKRSYAKWCKNNPWFGY